MKKEIVKITIGDKVFFKKYIPEMKDHIKDYMETLKFPMMSMKRNTGVKIKDIRLFLMGKKTFEETFTADQVRDLEKMFGLSRGFLLALSHNINRSKQLGGL